MKTIESIDREIEGLKERLGQLEGRPTEVYTRIVGYYRSLRNWNLGKREEYNHRVLFSQDSKQQPAKVTEIPPTTNEAAQTAPAPAETPASYTYFFRQTCPNCPAVLSLLSNVDLPGSDIDVDSTEGTELALKFSIYATPTAIFFDSENQELFRVTSAEELRSKMPDGLLSVPQTA
jgi:hypothetical protein